MIPRVWMRVRPAPERAQQWAAIKGGLTVMLGLPIVFFTLGAGLGLLGLVLSDDMAAIGWFMAVTCLITALIVGVVFVLSLPLILLTLRSGWIGALPALVCGALAGAAALMLWVGWAMGEGITTELARFGAISGAIASGLFWLGATTPRDRDRATE